jgi:hypothetical protein
MMMIIGGTLDIWCYIVHPHKMIVSAPNARINQAILAFLIGILFTDLPFDYHWFNYLLDDPSRLRSVVVASVRVAAAVTP